MGEHVIGTDPDCNKRKTFCNPKAIRRTIKEKDIIVHEGFDRVKIGKVTNLINDIALIRIDERIPLYQDDPTISAASPICLPWSEDSFVYFLEAGYNATVAGWGRIRRRNNANAKNEQQRNKAGSKNLLQVKLPISNCPKLPIDHSKQICAGGIRGKSVYNSVMMIVEFHS